MALDSREKRQNVVGVGRMWLRTPLPATVDEQWRISRSNAYGGNSLSAAADTIIAQARSVARFIQTRVFGRVN